MMLDEIEKRAREAKERAEKATDGPWQFDATPHLVCKWRVKSVSTWRPCARVEPWVCSTDSLSEQPMEDGVFIASARTDIPLLAADVIALLEIARAAENLMDNVFDAHDRDPRWASVPISSLKRVKDAFAKREAL